MASYNLLTVKLLETLFSAWLTMHILQECASKERQKEEEEDGDEDVLVRRKKRVEMKVRAGVQVRKVERD